ncbi:hypothetical protein [Roseobacter ponti]|uniref:Lipoprotein n=1 Tax=Roseobacter ponti TaxID=1891787 RepID=A0A858STI7_9RHOB|nr:hypothetical protein [Roseobacter ponti]QJF51630.1 hypothetical protein G3256_10895 [Roseobacter ponti]
MTTMKLAVLALILPLSACVQETSNPTASVASSGPPSVEEQACLRDVSRTTNNGDVVLLSSSFSQAGTQVVVGVGLDRARWECTGYSNGTTAGIISLTNEGTL